MALCNPSHNNSGQLPACLHWSRRGDGCEVRTVVSIGGLARRLVAQARQSLRIGMGTGMPEPWDITGRG